MLDGLLLSSNLGLFQSVLFQLFKRSRFHVTAAEEHDAPVGRVADVRRVHRHRADHGLGQQGHRDPRRRHGQPRRRFHAQEGPAAQVPLRAQRQGN